MQRILCVCPNPVIDVIVQLEQLQLGAEHRSLGENYYPGGKGVNVAKVASRLGLSTGLLCFWPRENAQWIRQYCELNCGIVCHGPQVEGWTRSHISLHAQADSSVTEIVGPGPAISRTDFEKFLADFRSMLGSYSTVVLSGSWPRGAPVDAYAQMIETAHRAGCWVLLDCASPWLEPALQCEPRALHANREEARQLITGAHEMAGMARELNQYCEIACLTDAAAGAWIASGGRVVHAHVRLDRVVNTLGSGDSLVAGMVQAIVEQRGLDQIAALAVACGAANCLQEQSGWIDPAELALLSKITQVREVRS